MSKLILWDESVYNQLSRSEALEKLKDAEMELRWAQHALDEAREALQFAYCDHPDVDGWQCHDCGEFVEKSEAEIEDEDGWRVINADSQEAPASDEYWYWLRARRVWDF